MTGNGGTPMGRRELLRGALAGGALMMAGGTSGGCSRSSPDPAASEPARQPASPPATTGAVLLAYFSRAGENYSYGGRNLTVGNTEVLACMISSRIVCELYRIEAVDRYPEDYEETVARNVREQNANARPAIANALPAVGGYRVVLLASPIWNVRAPMIMSTFIERLDFAGKTVHPVTTHAMSGLGTTMRDYAALCPGAVIGEGLAVRGEEVNDAGAAVDSWLRRVQLL